MLDKKTEMMLQMAGQLTAEDLDQLRALAPEPIAGVSSTAPVRDEANGEDAAGNDTLAGDAMRGERERKRTRESKVSTGCIGTERAKHDWWPIGTELVGELGSAVFSATVVENTQVKSGRSILITSGAAQGKVCLTPTRAAIEATEAYRQANNLGRGGGVTNGWTFWKPRQ